MKLFFTLSRAGLLLLICIAFYIYNYVEYFQCLYKSDFKCLYEKDQASLLPPIAKRAESKFNIRNHSFVEHYNWMKTMSDDTKAYIKAENQYARHRISLKTEIRNSFVKKLEHWTKAAETERIQEFWETRTYVYFVDSNATYPRYLRRRKTSKCFTPSGIINTDEVVLDYNLIVPSSAKTFIHGFFEVSSDETLLAYAYDLEGNERFKLHIRNLTTLKELDILPVDTYYSARWHREDQTENLFFNRVNAEFGVPTEIYQICIIGCAHSRLESIKVYSEKDPSLTTELVKTNDCEFLFIKIAGQITSEYRLASKPAKVLFSREMGVYYDVEHHNTSFVIRHNRPPSENFEVIQIPEDQVLSDSSFNTSLFSKQVIIIKHSEDQFIELIEVFRDNLVGWTRNNGLREILVINLHPEGISTKLTFYKKEDLESESYSVFPSSALDMESRIYRDYYSPCMTFTNVSYTRLPQTYFYHFENQTTLSSSRLEKLYPGKEIRVFALTKDSRKRIPISVLHKYSVQHPSPLILHVYGAYGSFMDPSFNVNLLPLLDIGVTYASCHPRGDADMGADWYKSGKYDNKMNTFHDTEQCIKALIDQGFALKGKIAIYSRSAGGLVAGYAINHFPFVDVVASQVPFVDPIQDMIDDKVPWTAYEWFEWGDPRQSETILEAMIRYSPYENIKARNSPSVYFSAGVKDSRVPYYEPLKFIAKLREAQSHLPNSPEIIIQIQEAGHFPSSSEELADLYSFILSHIL